MIDSGPEKQTASISQAHDQSYRPNDVLLWVPVPRSTGRALDILRAVPPGGGDVVGPSSAIDDRVVLFDGTTGKLIKSDGHAWNMRAGNFLGLPASPAFISHGADRKILEFNSVGSLARNWLAITSAVSGDPAILSAESDTDTDVDVQIKPKGAGSVDADNSIVKNVLDPTAAQHAATKSYVDSEGFLKNVEEDTSPTLGGDLDIGAAQRDFARDGDIVLRLIDVASAVDFLTISNQPSPNGASGPLLTPDGVSVNTDLRLSGKGTGNIQLLSGVDVNANKIANVLDPTAAQDAATKNYVDSEGFLKNLVEDASPQLGGMLDVNGQALGDGVNALLSFFERSSPTSNVEIFNGNASSDPKLRVVGGAANISLELEALGTGTVKVKASGFVVEDGAARFDGGDFTVDGSNFHLFVDDALARTGIATGTPARQFHVASESQSSRGVNISNHSDAAQDPLLVFSKSRGTEAAATRVADADRVGSFFFQGHDGASYLTVAGLRAVVNGTPAAGNVPVDMTLETGKTGSRTEKARLTEAGLVGIGQAVPTGQLHVDQADVFAARPVLVLDQADVSEEMIEFISVIGGGNPIEAVGAKTLTTTHFIKVTLPGSLTRYIPAGTIA